MSQREPLQHEDRRSSPWPYRVARVLVCATFPLIFVGGLVTTYQAGMAVPDWPNTYGYNLFLYPLATWWSGPWDLFVEHGHRLFGAAVGMLTLLLAGLAWRYEPRRWVRRLSYAAVGLVIFQGLLGGSRVLLDDRTLAMLHGCTAPLFFATVTALAVVLSPKWRDWGGEDRPRLSSKLPATLATALALCVYCQIVLGSQLRHLQPWSRPQTLQAFVWFHVVLAAITLTIALWLAWSTLRSTKDMRPLRRPAMLLPLIFVLQIGLGTATWIVQYGFPSFMQSLPAAAGYVVRAESFTQTSVTTAHVAIGSLILAVATMLALRLARTSWSHDWSRKPIRHRAPMRRARRGVA